MGSNASPGLRPAIPLGVCDNPLHTHTHTSPPNSDPGRRCPPPWSGVLKTPLTSTPLSKPHSSRHTPGASGMLVPWVQEGPKHYTVNKRSGNLEGSVSQSSFVNLWTKVSPGKPQSPGRGTQRHPRPPTRKVAGRRKLGPCCPLVVHSGTAASGHPEGRGVLVARVSLGQRTWVPVPDLPETSPRLFFLHKWNIIKVSQISVLWVPPSSSCLSHLYILFCT